MKTHIRILPVVLASLALSCAAHAALMVDESYQNYTAGVVTDNTIAGNALGISTANLRLVGSANATVEIVNGTAMTYTGGSISVDGGSQYLKISSSQADLPATTLGATLSTPMNPVNGSFYMSFLYRYDGSYTGGEVALASFTANATTQPGSDAWLGSGSQSFFARTSVGSATGLGAAGSVVNNTTYFMVAKYTSNGTAWTGADLWLNPTSSTLGTPTASTAVGSSTTVMGALLPFAQGLDSNDSFQIDRLQISTTLTDVIPEPSTWLLLAASATGFVVFRRRRNV